jgi:cold shock CspA family protein
MDTLTATVHWFDATSGEGMAICDQTGEPLYLHYTCIAGIARNGYAYPTQADQQRLRGIAGRSGPLTVYRNLYSARVMSLDLGFVRRAADSDEQGSEISA